MSEKMLVTQALDERGLLVKKINDKFKQQNLLIQSSTMKKRFLMVV